MKLYLISQSVNNDYDTYSDAVVCAKDKQDAKTIHPSGRVFVSRAKENYNFGDWARNFKEIKVEEIGTANNKQKRGVICSSFHAG
jgi:hypothetical protein